MLAGTVSDGGVVSTTATVNVAVAWLPLTSDAVHANYGSMLTQKGSAFTASMLRDVESGGQAEGDHILGAMLARARQHSLAAPVLEIAATHLETYAVRRAREAAAKAK